MKNIIKDISIRVRIVFIGFTIFSVFLVGRILFIQFTNKEILKNANKYLYEEKIISPSRGNIIDCNGHILATSLPFYTIAIDPSLLSEEDFKQDLPEFVENLHQMLNEKTPEEYLKIIKEAINQKKRYLKLSTKKIKYDAKLIVETWPLFKKKKEINVGILEKTEIRFRPFKNLFSRGIGYVNQGSGVGIEYTYDKYLSGKPGRAMHKRIVGSAWKQLNSTINQDPINGFDIQTTIDINLQDIAHKSLLDVLQEANGDYGCVILMEVKTGEIKAMVNLGKSETGEYEENYNYAIGNNGVREPGSVFKLISMIAILEKGKINLDDEIETTPYIYWHNVKLNESNNKGWGIIPIRDALVNSSNTAITKLVVDQFGTSPEEFIEIVKKLKFDVKTDINMEGEGKPFVPQPKTKKWSGISLPWLSIGYGIEISPMQIIQLYNAVANNGVMVKPKIVKKIMMGKTIIKSFPTEIVVKKICSKNTLKEIKEMLKDVVERGTATSSKDSFYKIAGKSGTANTVEGGKYSKKTYTTFVGYFPEDNPKYSCIVLIDNPKNFKWHYGGRLSWVVKQIAGKISSQDLEYYA